MKINHLLPSKINGTIPQSEVEEVSKNKGVNKKVKRGFVSVDFSESSKIVKKAAQRFRELPEIRKDKVEAIKAKLKNNSYRVSDEQIAEKMLEEIVEEASLCRKK